MQVSYVSTYLHTRNQRVVVYSLVKTVTRRQRLRDRILAVSPSAIYLFNPAKMMGSDYEPMCVPLANVKEVRVPRQPETKCFVHLRVPVKKKNYLELVSPNRTKLLLRLKEIYSGVPGSRNQLQVIETQIETSTAGRWSLFNNGSNGDTRRSSSSQSPVTTPTAGSSGASAFGFDE